MINNIQEAKEVILRAAVETNNCIHVFDSNSATNLIISNRAPYETERERRLVLEAHKQLLAEGLVEFVSGVMYEVTYPGYLQGLELLGRRPMYQGDAISHAQNNLLSGALKSGGIWDVDGTLNTFRHYLTGRVSYSSPEELRLLYRYAMLKLLEEDAVQYKSGIMFELTVNGFDRAEALKNAGFKQDDHSAPNALHHT